MIDTTIKDFSGRVQGPLQAYHDATGVKVDAGQLWQGARNKFATAKAGDLLWRFLHQKVEVGVD